MLSYALGHKGKTLYPRTHHRRLCLKCCENNAGIWGCMHSSHIRVADHHLFELVRECNSDNHPINRRTQFENTEINFLLKVDAYFDLSKLLNI